ncbi:MAG TPA: glycosyltransferase family 4 protein [Pseudolabrys sp.]|uniref:glycosyltransferase family 4 protein n=1 Tax=Pseudolabrys sp. TaxID=1960880 RepID=UPI002DDCD04A|nr:glycosyltransferase family 4 protein [Pseudolabrys sp.]HEV2630172.1 glycosyltransferase family 4 protein [Pseudolabrys sp.]
MARLIFVNRFFYPDHSATSQILSDLAFALSGNGHDVHVVTSQQIYDQPAASLPAEETVNGVRVHRVLTTRYGRAGLSGRAVDYLSFYASVVPRLREAAGRDDIVIAKTDPPLISVVAAGVARHRSAHLVNWLQDIYPEVAMELKVPLTRPAARALIPPRNWSLRTAKVNVVLGTSMAARLAAIGVAADRIRIIPNWIDDRAIMPVPRKDNALRREWKLQDKFVVGYSGNLGRAHEFETLLAAADRLRSDPRFAFVVIGGGRQFDRLAGAVDRRKLTDSFRLLPYQDRQQLRLSLGVPDVHWISMHPPLEGLIFPSKFYGIAAAGRPLIALTGGRGEIAELVRRHDCGVVVEPGDADGFARTLTKLADDPALCTTMGARARAMLEQQFSRQHAIAAWEALLKTLAPEDAASRS